MKVSCNTCGKLTYLRPCRVGVYKKNYCSRECHKDERIRWIGYIYANRLTSNTTSIAEHIGIPVPTLRTWIVRANSEMPASHHIRFPKGPPRKAEHEKAKRKVYYVKKVKVPKPPKEKKPRQKRELKPKSIKRKIAAPKHKIAKVVRQLNTIIRDESKYQYIKINNKTWKQVLKQSA